MKREWQGEATDLLEAFYKLLRPTKIFYQADSKGASRPDVPEIINATKIIKAYCTVGLAALFIIGGLRDNNKK